MRLALACLLLAACTDGFRVEAVGTLPASIASVTANGDAVALRPSGGMLTLSYARDFDSYRVASRQHIVFVFSGSDASTSTLDVPLSSCEDACASPSCPTAGEIELERFDLAPFATTYGRYSMDCIGDGKAVAVIP